ncbi:SDR family oxidoreductase [Gordonia sp. TBRC 11910]|uniref:SDR family oxidoreductase n=1 Tax=Gordonia asplenii TaxID=2725283 RepID=A0A848KUP9_9ACTN|nr:SDR family oxidoreductase [Gordonia asplenii]NMO01747.1 SDR family oxidoreductase [Gordonia asplenii]
MSNYLVTGGTGFLGRRVLPLLLTTAPDADIHVLVRASSADRLRRLAENWEGGDRIHPLVGDLTAPRLGVANPPSDVTDIIHLGAVYDMTATAEESERANVAGTTAVIELAQQLDATLHHISSVAVAGDHHGRYTEDDFDLGQNLPSPYHATKFMAEKLVRDTDGLRWRVYRPAIVVGDSTTGEMDKIDGPYYFFSVLEMASHLPSLLPTVIPDFGATNVVPVDYVAAALVQLVTTDGLDGRAFHLVNPKPQSTEEVFGALFAAAGAPKVVGAIPEPIVAQALRFSELPGVKVGRDLVLDQLGVPPEVIDHMSFESVFSSEKTQEALGADGPRVPRFGTYAKVLWQYWYDNLDPNMARRSNPAGALAGRRVVITGGSSGIGLATAHLAAKRGARVILIARKQAELDAAVAEVNAKSGIAFGYSCDITDPESVSATVKAILADHDHVDYLVNNAGRSIRRSVVASVDRMHDYERTMNVNYFGAVRLILELLPSMRERRFGHIVNISSIGVQTKVPRFSAYVASKAALDAFSDVISSELVDDGIGFTSIRMPLVRTPMIAPTTMYKSMPAYTPEEAAEVVVRALERRPTKIDTPVGTMAEALGVVAPHLKNLLLHQAYRLFPDSSAARGEESSGGSSKGGLKLPEVSLPSGAKRIVGLLPGIHW